MNIRTKLDFALSRPTAVALGFFDGVHKGHQRVIGEAVSRKKEGLVPVVFSFTIGENAPLRKNGNALVQTNEKREQCMAELGVEELVIPEFSTFSGFSAKEFVEIILVGQLYAKVVICGEDFHFGKGAVAGVQELRSLLEPYGVKLCTIPAVWHLGSPISSTRIRNALAMGEMPLANDMLGRPYEIEGIVEHGKKLGRKLGFPTVNLSIPRCMVELPYGVYATSVEINGKRHYAVSNIGTRPTVDGTARPNLESYILGFCGNLYGENLTVHIHEFLRKEEKFDSVTLLRAAIQRDVSRVEEKYVKKIEE